MPSSKLSVVVDPPTDLKGMTFVAKVIDPEINKFCEWFATRGTPGKPAPVTTKMEREILRSYLWWATKERDDG